MNFLDILKEDKPYLKLIELQNSGELVELCPELSNLDEKVTGHKNNFYHTMGVLKNVCDSKNNTFKMKVVALFHDIGKLKTKSFESGEWTFYEHEKVSAKMVLIIFKRMEIEDKVFIDYVYRMIYYHGRTKIPRDVTESAIRRFGREVGLDIINDLMDFCKCDITTKWDDKRERFQSALDIMRNRIFEINKKDEESKWRSPLTGEIIMKTLNIEPCKLIGDIKKKYEPLFKEGKITLEEAIKQIKDENISNTSERSHN